MPIFEVKSANGTLRFGGPEDWLQYVNLILADIGYQHGYRVAIEPMPPDEPKVVRF